MSRPRDGGGVRTRTPVRHAQVTKEEPKGSVRSDPKSDASSQKQLSNRERNDDVSDDVIGSKATNRSKRTRIETKLWDSSNEATTTLWDLSEAFLDAPTVPNSKNFSFPRKP